MHSKSFYLPLLALCVLDRADCDTGHNIIKRLWFETNFNNFASNIVTTSADGQNCCYVTIEGVAGKILSLSIAYQEVCVHKEVDS